MLLLLISQLLFKLLLEQFLVLVLEVHNLILQLRDFLLLCLFLLSKLLFDILQFLLKHLLKLQFFLFLPPRYIFWRNELSRCREPVCGEARHIVFGDRFYPGLYEDAFGAQRVNVHDIVVNEYLPVSRHLIMVIVVYVVVYFTLLVQSPRPCIFLEFFREVQRLPDQMHGLICLI